MQRKYSRAVPAALITFLLVSLVFQVWIFPAAINRAAAVFPEVGPLVVPAILWAVATIGCLQAGAIIGLRASVRVQGNIAHASGLGWLYAIIGCLIAFVVLIAAAFVSLNLMGYTPPGVMIGLIVVGGLALAAAGSVGLFLGTRPAVRVPHG